MATFQTKIGERTYTCHRILVLDQIEILPDLGDLDESLTGLKKELIVKVLRLAKVSCDSVTAGDVVLEDAEVCTHVNDHFTDLTELFEVFSWALSCSIG